MEQYKAKLQRRINALSLVAVGTALIYAGLVFFRGQLPAVPSFIKGFHIGAFIGLELIIAFYLGKCMQAIKNADTLKKMRIAETDERTGLVLQKASSLGMSVMFFGLGLAAIISGFLNVVMFFTLLGVLFFALVVFYTLWVYFARKL